MTDIVENTCFFDRHNTPRKEIVRGLIRESQIVILAGGFGVGKSPLLDDLIVRRASGIDWLNRSLVPGPTILMDLENDGPTVRNRIRAIAGKLNVRLPEVPTEVEIYMHNDSLCEEGTRIILNLLPKDRREKIGFLTERLRSKPNALLVIDPLDMFFGTDRMKSREVLELYSDLRKLLTEYPEAACILTLNIRKKIRMARQQPNLVTDPRDWLEEVAGTLDLVNRSDVRLGVDFHQPGSQVRVLNGVRRGEDMEPILFRPAGDDESPAGFELVPPGELRLEELLTRAELNYWNLLPEVFRFCDALDIGVPRSTLWRLLRKSGSFGLLRKENDTYHKVH